MHTLTAIAETEVLLFLIDARAGITAGDQIIAQTLRKSGKPVILAANKCEGRVEVPAEAYGLGLGEPLRISAEHNLGMEDLVAFDNEHLGRLAEMIFDRLQPFFKEDAARRLLADGLQVDKAAWLSVVGPEHALRILCARRLAAGALGDFSRLDALFNGLQKTANWEDRSSLLGVLRSHWVPLGNATRLDEAFKRLAPVATDAPPCNVVVLQTEFSAAGMVAELHRERRFQPFGKEGRWLTLTLGDEAEAALRAKLCSELQGRLFVLEPAIEAEEMIEELDGMRQRGDPTFVHLGGVVTLAHLLPVARQFWPCLFVLTARATASVQLAGKLHGAPIAPPDPQEKFHMRAYSAAQGLLDEQQKQTRRAAPP